MCLTVQYAGLQRHYEHCRERVQRPARPHDTVSCVLVHPAAPGSLGLGLRYAGAVPLVLVECALGIGVVM